MSYKLISEGGIVRNLFEVEIEQDGVGFTSPISFYVSADRADHEALRLSKLLPGYRVSLGTMARFKAVYRDGVRVGDVKDYRRDFYTNLTDEQYEATKIQDSRTAEWI